jgi:hypothetical protein
MSRLVRLYPKAWRARYESELRETLATRRLTLRDRTDLVRGALDAWLHPELVGRSPVLAGGHGVLIGDLRSRSPMTFATSIGVAAFLLAGYLILTAGETLLGGRQLQQALLAVGAAALGAIVWRSGRDHLAWRLAAVALFLGTLSPIASLLPEASIPWRSIERRLPTLALLALAGVTMVVVVIRRMAIPVPSARTVGVAAFSVLLGAAVIAQDLGETSGPWMPLSAQLTTALPVVIGTLVLGIHITVRGSPDRATGVMLIVLALVLAVGFRMDSVRLLAVTSMGFAVATARLGWWPGSRVVRPTWMATRDVLPGIIAGLAIVALVAAWSIGTSAWTSHDGFALRCDIARSRCLSIVERVVGDVGRSRAMGIEWVHVDARGGVEVCWVEPVTGRGCWLRSPTEAERSMPL